jgi:hypothetical protein
VHLLTSQRSGHPFEYASVIVVGQRRLRNHSAVPRIIHDHLWGSQYLKRYTPAEGVGRIDRAPCKNASVSDRSAAPVCSVPSPAAAVRVSSISGGVILLQLQRGLDRRQPHRPLGRRSRPGPSHLDAAAGDRVAEKVVRQELGKSCRRRSKTRRVPQRVLMASLRLVPRRGGSSRKRSYMMRPLQGTGLCMKLLIYTCVVRSRCLIAC